MASKAPSSCCLKAFKHEGESTGKIVDINGINTYVAGTPSKKVIVIFTDVFGHVFINAQLLADQFAENGFFVVMPDLFNGDALPMPPPANALQNWLPHHGPDVTQPIVAKFLEGLKKEYDPTFVGAIGYCFGAKYVFQQLGSGAIQAGAVCHPSFVTIEEVRAIKGPILICAAETDQIFPEESRYQTEAALKELKATYFITLASGVEHGFAVKGDISNPVVKLAKEKAFWDAVWWFQQFSK